MMATDATRTTLTPAEAAALLAKWDAWARRIAAKWHAFNPSADPDDILSETRVGFVEAARRFDPSRGISFGTYAAWWGHNFARQFCRRERTKGLRGFPARVAWGDAPTVASLSVGDEDNHGRRWADQLPGRPEGEPRADLDDWWAVHLRDLPQRSREVVERRVRGGESLHEIGAALGIGAERVRQVFEQAMARLRRTVRVG
jgi:RNA polymerase sigma factor (sigma-70 family)